MKESDRGLELPAVGGEMEARVRSFDWSRTSLGPRSLWPTSLKTIVATLLGSRQPMFLWWGPDLIQIYNDAYVPSFGAGKHPAALGQPGRECWPEIWDIIGPEIAAAMNEGKASWHEDALVPIFRNGAIEQVYWTYGYSPAFDDEGRIAGTLVICTETTTSVLGRVRDRARQDQAEKARLRLLTLFQQVPAGVCILRGSALVFDFANAEYERLVGRTGLVGHALLDAIPELRGQGFDDLVRQVMSSGEPFVGHEVLVKLDTAGPNSSGPTDFFVTFSYSPFRDSAESVVGVIAVIFDVTARVSARRRADELARRLRASEDQLNWLSESMPQLAWAARPDGHLDWYNRRWYEYTGTALGQMEGWGWKAAVDPAFVDEVVARWSDSVASGIPFEMRFPLRRHDGVLRWHLAQAMPTRDAAGAIIRWFGTNTDIDESQQVELQRIALLEREQAARQVAESANRAKDDFLTTASHELRTPLTAILGWARLLRRGRLDPSGYLRAVETIERNAQAQVRLIEDILDGSRVITGNLHLEIRALDMTAVVRTAIDALRPAADAKGIQLLTDREAPATQMVGDPERLQQVVWNLVSNAIKFTPKEGTVSVSLTHAGTDIELKVSDSGQGINPQFLPHVFERFRQAEGSTTRRHGGLGLGLALVRDLVEAHGGNVRAESAGDGCGATFTVTLPVQALVSETAVAALRRPPVGCEPTRPAGNLSDVAVLVVDDELDARELVSTVLRQAGAQVTTAASAAAALELLALSSYGAMVSDVGMPDTDGYTLVRQLRRLAGTRNGRLPVIALTAYAREEDRRLALEAGFDAYVSKPVEPDLLIRLVAELAKMPEAPAPTRPIARDRADTFAKFEGILTHQGLHQALRFLNSRTPHRFTGIYRFDPPLLRSVELYDAGIATVRIGDDVPLANAYCSVVGDIGSAFTTEDARRDDRLREHPARDNVVSYCGVLLRRRDGTPFGTLCHFDLVACEVPLQEMALMQAAAARMMQHLEATVPAAPDIG